MLQPLKKKKSTFKTTSSCTNMESYSHPGVYQQMNERKNRESAFCPLFFSFFSMIHFSSRSQKRQKVTSRGNINQSSSSWVTFPSTARSIVTSPEWILLTAWLSASCWAGLCISTRRKGAKEPTGCTASLLHHTTPGEHELSTQPALFAPGCY